MVSFKTERNVRQQKLQESVLLFEDKPENKKKSDSSIVNDVQSEPLRDSKSSNLPVEKPSAPIYPPSESNSSSSISQKTIPLRHPDPPSLQQPLEFAKTLRPLIRRVDSGRKTVLDEVETVKRTAEEGICIPILKSESEPWLDLALVVDENSSMIIWRNTVKELKQLLEHYGIFREVRTWGLTTDKYGDITLRVKVGQKESFKNPQELIDPTHRRLILIVSDCVAPIWFDGTILSTLEDWTKHQPMAIVQMLPDSMWLRTGLRLGASVELVNLIPGAANRNLRIHELLLWKDINLERGTKIPVLTLNPEFTSLWSDFLVGKYDRVMAGFVTPSALDFRPPPKLPQSQVKELNAEQRVKRFRKISSPLGRKLAGLLMAAPVITLPVVRLIQKTLLPQSQPVHVAEVFLGGLLKPLTKITTDINPDGVLFDVMHNGIRDILLDDAPFSDSVIIFETISDYIESQLGKSLRECVGLLKKSSENGEGEEETVVKAYAKISLEVLKRLGGNYLRWPEEIIRQFFDDGRGNKFLSHCLVYEIPVPMVALEEVCDSLPNYQQQLQIWLDLGLIEMSSEPKEEDRVYRVSRILPHIITNIQLPQAPKVYRKAHNKLYELWGNKENESEEKWREIFRLLFAEKDNRQRFRQGFSQMLAVQYNPQADRALKSELRQLKAELSEENFCCQLEDYLRQGDWRKADEETAWLFYLVMVQQGYEYWDELCRKLPSEILNNIDQLWVNHSQGKFGFSIQKRIWDNVVENSINYETEKNLETEKKFCKQVEWLEKNNWKEYKSLPFSLESVEGNLPARWITWLGKPIGGFGNPGLGTLGIRCRSLFSRIKT